jgi:hypothetical protein
MIGAISDIYLTKTKRHTEIKFIPLEGELHTISVARGRS